MEAMTTYTVPGMVRDPEVAKRVGRLGGLMKTEAQTRARRENGKKGGRPKQKHRNPLDNL